MYALKQKPETVLDTINNIKQMWDAAISFQKQGTFDTDAMYQIYQAMNPRLTFRDIANVFSGVYADTYWATDYMNSDLLAKSMIQALGLDPNLAAQYASSAMSQWRGILCRKNINDTGTIPVVGSYVESLDIVCNQNASLPPAQLIDNWNNEFWKTPQVGKNYIYARCQNMAFNGIIEKPQIQMFYTTGGFNQPPSSWIQCLTDSGSKKVGQIVDRDGKPANLAQGDRAVSEAFFFNPTSNQHVCVIAAINSEFFSGNNPLQIKPGNWNSYTWITSNGAAAWHNVDPQTNKLETLAYFNQDGTQEKFSFVLNCRNVPVGSKVRLFSDDALAKFDTGTVAIVDPSQSLQTSVSVPPHHAGNLKMELQGPDGGLLPIFAAVEVQMKWDLPHTHQNYLDAVQATRSANQLRTLQNVQLTLGAFTITGSGR